MVIDGFFFRLVLLWVVHLVLSPLHSLKFASYSWWTQRSQKPEQIKEPLKMQSYENMYLRPFILIFMLLIHAGVKLKERGCFQPKITQRSLILDQL